MADNKHYSEDRKYSLIDKSVSKWLKDEAKNGTIGLCHGRFHADYEIEDLSKYKVGDSLNVGGKNIEITIIGKNCYPNECPLFKSNNAPCPLKMGVAFAKNC